MQRPFLPPANTGPEIQRAVQDLALAQQRVSQQINVLSARPVVQPDTLPTLYGPGVQRSALSNTGTHPLNVNGLAGLLLQPQTPLLKTYATAAEASAATGNQSGVAAVINGQIVVYNSSTATWDEITHRAIYVGLHMDRMLTYDAADYQEGTLFYETDRHVTYIVLITSTVHNWWYLCGEMDCHLGPYVTRDVPTDLASMDAGFKINSLDYKHQHVWTGSQWEFSPGDAGNCFIVAGPTGTGPWQTGLWFPCTGGACYVAGVDSVPVQVTTPDLSGDVFILGAVGTIAVPTQSVATTPTWEVGAKTEDEHTHKHGTTALSTSAGGNIINAGSGVAGASSNLHTHTITGNTDVGDAHSHELKDSNAKLNKPSEDNGGLPVRIKLSWFMRI